MVFNMRTIKTLLVAVTLLTASTAFSLTPPPARDVDFDKLDEVTVERLEPDAITLRWLQERAAESLIRIRVGYVPEIVRSAADI